MTEDPVVRTNPFAGFGKPVGGERFIGREKVLRTIEARVTDPERPGNLALVGEPRIGKSSIAHQAIRCRHKELLARRRVPVWLRVNLYKSGLEVFKAFVKEVVAELANEQWLTPELDRLSAAIDRCETLNGEVQAMMFRFFAVVRRRGVVVIAVLDEFDNAARLWSSDRPGFQLLRELSQDPELAIGVITTSRRELSDIERSSGVISTLAGTFMRTYVRPFEDGEARVMLDRLVGAGVPLEEASVPALENLTGWHPFFLDMVCFYAFEAFRGGKGVDATVLDESAEQFIETYEHQVTLMRRDGVLGKAMQILFGPVIDVTKLDVNRLLRQGIIRVVSERYQGYSLHFEGYLRAVSREADLWPLWRDAEQALRRCVAAYMVEKYGSPWKDAFCKARPNLAGMVRRWEELMLEEGRRYGSEASTNLLDYCYPGEMFSLIRTDWPWFRNIFGGQSTEWEGRFKTLAQVRTPLAHNRLPESYRGLIDEATGICRQVLDRIVSWEQVAEGSEQEDRLNR